MSVGLSGRSTVDSHLDRAAVFAEGRTLPILGLYQVYPGRVQIILWQPMLYILSYSLSIVVSIVVFTVVSGIVSIAVFFHKGGL